MLLIILCDTFKHSTFVLHYFFTHAVTLVNKLHCINQQHKGSQYSQQRASNWEQVFSSFRKYFDLFLFLPQSVAIYTKILIVKNVKGCEICDNVYVHLSNKS